MNGARTTTLAAVQAAPVFLDLEASLEKAVDLIAQAAERGARVIRFAETWLPGYPALIFGAAGWEDPAAKRAYARLARNSVEVPGPAVDRLCDAAREAEAVVVMGAHERDTATSGGTLFNSQLIIGPDGALLGVHRKLMPTHAERILWGAGDGSTLHVLDTPYAKVGGLVCWEHWMPLARFAMHAKGEEVHVASWPDAPESHHIATRHYAFEGRCFVICAAGYLRASDVPDDFDLRHLLREGIEVEGDEDEWMPGGSGIIAPDGSWLAGPVFGREEVITAEVHLDRIREEQQALDAVGHYNRPDVFRLTVDERPQQHVTWLGERVD